MVEEAGPRGFQGIRRRYLLSHTRNTHARRGLADRYKALRQWGREQVIAPMTRMSRVAGRGVRCRIGPRGWGAGGVGPHLQPSQVVDIAKPRCDVQGPGVKGTLGTHVWRQARVHTAVRTYVLAAGAVLEEGNAHRPDGVSCACCKQGERD